jgi:hypothetical protein
MAYFTFSMTWNRDAPDVSQNRISFLTSYSPEWMPIRNQTYRVFHNYLAWAYMGKIGALK